MTMTSPRTPGNARSGTDEGATPAAIMPFNSIPKRQEDIRRRHCWVWVAGFDGVQRVVGMVQQRRYVVHSFRAESAGHHNWIVNIVFDTTWHDESTSLLIKRLNRLPSTLKVRYSRSPPMFGSIWD